MNAEFESTLGEIRSEHNKAPSQRYTDRFQQRHRRHPYVESEPVLQGLALEVEEIKRRGESEMYLLKGTGFQVKAQVDLLLENRLRGIPLSESLDQLDQDIQGFKTEYLLELPVFPILLERGVYEGKERIVGKLYGGKPLSETTSSDERQGVVKSSIQKVEDALLSAKPGTLIMMASPGGWSGYQSREGRLEPINRHDILSGKAKEVVYPDSQGYCFKVLENGEIRAFTLKTDMTLAQNKELLKRLGAPNGAFETPKDEITEIKEVVDTVLVIDPNRNKKIEDIVQTIKHIKGSEVVYWDSKKEARYFSEMEELLENPEGLWSLDEKTRELTSALRTYILERSENEDSDFRTDLETAMGLTVLKLMHEVRPKKSQQSMEAGKTYVPSQAQLVKFNARDVYNELKEISGCAGGGGGDEGGSSVESVTPRNAKTLNSKEGCECPDKSDNHYHCPDCNKKYEDETHKDKRTEKCDCGFEFGC